MDTFSAVELLPEVRQAFAEGLVDESIIALHDVDPSVKRPTRSYPIPAPEDRFLLFRERNAPIDAIAECSVWICFCDENEDSELEAPDEYIDREDVAGHLPASPVYEPTPYTPLQPYIAPPKIGRNDPCPCGSGKKYKKCCGKL